MPCVVCVKAINFCSKPEARLTSSFFVVNCDAAYAKSRLKGRSRKMGRQGSWSKHVKKRVCGIVSYSFDVILSHCWLYDVLSTCISTTSSLNLYVLQTDRKFSDFVGELDDPLG